mmetsp:Transcript_21900/g.44670  ORF Transcript_21900/g.44670 Transcript_21900/m.44670 type:complete len:262 (+) Transcript_21900:879-1664(+)
MSHGKNHRLDQFLNLLIRPPDVRIFLRGSLVHLHGLDPRIELGGQFFENEIRVFVGPHEIGRFEFLHVHETGNGEVNRLTGRGPYHGAARFALRIGIGRGSLFPAAASASFLFQESVLRLGLQHLHDVPHQIGQLLIQFDLLDVLADPLPLGPALVLDALDVGAHDANVVVDEVDSLAEFGGGHGGGFVVEDVLFFFGGFGFFGGGGGGGCGVGGRRGGVGFVIGVIVVVVVVWVFGAASIAPDVGSFEIVVAAHGGWGCC